MNLLSGVSVSKRSGHCERLETIRHIWSEKSAITFYRSQEEWAALFMSSPGTIRNIEWEFVINKAFIGLAML